MPVLLDVYKGTWSLVICNFSSCHMWYFCTPFQMPVVPDLCLGGLTDIAELSRFVNFTWNALVSFSLHNVRDINYTHLEAALRGSKCHVPFSFTRNLCCRWLSQEPHAAEVSINPEKSCATTSFPSPTYPAFNLLGALCLLLGYRPLRSVYVHQPSTETLLPVVCVCPCVPRWSKSLNLLTIKP